MHKHGGDIYTFQGLVDYSANINPLGIPESIIAAVGEAAKEAAQYPDVEYRELKAAIAKKEGIAKEYITCGNGAADLIFNVVLAKKPKKAVLIAPTFYEYEQALESVDCEISYYYLQEKHGFQIQEDYLTFLDESVDIAFLCNPNNPTGHTVSREFLEKALKKCKENNILFILDECFNDFLDAPQDYTMKDSIKENEHLFILRAFTKMYAMAGLRLGYGFCGNTQLLTRMKEVSQPWSVSTPAQKAGIAALKEDAYVEKTRKLIKEERKYLLEALKDLGFTVYHPMANYIFFKAPSSLGENIKKHGFMIRDCSNYHGLHQGYYRIAIKDHALNGKLIAAIKKSIGGLRK